MIIEFKFKNVLSFKDWTVLDFRATKNKKDDLKDYGVGKIGKDVLCKMAVIYGANASGKSNLLKVFYYFKNVVLSDRKDKEEKIDIHPFLLDSQTEKEPSEFEILFYSNNMKYFYRLKVDSSQIHYELLQYYPSVKPKMIFERKTENGVSHITFNKDIKIQDAVKKEIEARCLKNLSFFKAYQKANIENELIDNVIKFFEFMLSFSFLRRTTRLSFWDALRDISSIDILAEFYYNRLIYDKKNDVIDFLKKADFNITDINFETKEIKIGENTINYRTIKSFTHLIKNKNEEYKSKELPLELQSDGTKKIVSLFSVILTLCEYEKTKIILMDEIENSIHPLLLKHFIKKILNTDNNIQIIFTTHYDPLLEWEDIIRKDFIWFTSKREDGSTELYPLTDFNGLNRISNLKKAYIYGNFGAVPDIKEE